MDSSTGSAADKKRNKLGYHRTSVACVHCRRRKIRCLLAANDAQGRCENCIRLKKECHFYPVDQQPAVDKRGRTGTKIDTAGAEVASATTPSILGGTQLTEQGDSFIQFPGMPINASQDGTPLTPGRFAETPMAGLPSDSLPVSHVGTAPPLNQPISWDSNFFGQHGTGITSGTPLNAGTDGIIQQEAPLAVSLSSTSPIVISQNPIPMVPSNISAGQIFNAPQEAVAWGIQVSGPMSVSDPSGAAPSQYVGPLQAPSPIGAAGLRSQMTSPGTAYTALNHLAPEPQPAGLGASFVTQAPVMAYQTWNGLPGATAEVLHSGQIIVGTAPGSLAIPGWYQHDALQYSGMPPDETQIMEGHNQGSFDAGALHRQG